MENQPALPDAVELLRRQIARLEQPRQRHGEGLVSSGCQALDRLLPEGGLCRGTLVEWLGAGEGSGAASLALGAAGEACRDGGVLVVLDRNRDFYPPAAVRWGIDPRRLIVLQPAGDADHTWALDQSLRCRGVAAVLASAEKLAGWTFRRLQLAVEEGGGVGLLIRPDAVQHEPSWAAVRLLVEPLPAASPQSNKRRLRIHLLRCRGGTGGRSIDVEFNDETHTVHLAPQVAAPTALQRAARA